MEKRFSDFDKIKDSIEKAEREARSPTTGSRHTFPGAATSSDDLSADFPRQVLCLCFSLRAVILLAVPLCCDIVSGDLFMMAVFGRELSVGL